MTKMKNLDEARQLIRKMANNNKSDPFFYNRVLSHYKNGVLTIQDIREGTTE